MKRICAMLLALAMVLTVFPGAARAEEDGHIHQEEVTAPSEETAAPTEEPTQPSGEPAEAPTEEPTEEPTQAPEEKLTERSGTASISSGDVFGDEVTNEDLFAAYADRLFSPMGIMPFSVGGESAGARLTGDEAKAYNAMVPIIQQIAAGQRASAEITIGTNAPDGNFDFTTTIDTFDYTAVVTALLRDYPYEMYWFSFVEYRMGWSYYEDGTLYQFTYFLTVTPPFRGSDAYSIDTAKAASTSTAAANARAIVDQYAGQSDYNKLLGYKNEICSRVSYEHDALEDGYFEGNNNPWQLIYCFDDDPTTNIVCEGYSKAFQYLCDMSGLTCYSVTGDCGGGHMWNIVTLDGRNYMADITNSDSGTWGSDGSLFLVGGQGSVAEGYTFYDDYGYSISFYYDQKCIDTWGEEVLTLSDTDYVSHTHSYSSVVTAPTCTEGGYTTYTCSSCGSSYQSDYTTALGHNSVTDSAKAATCTEDGLTEGSHCSRCNTVLAAQQTIPALGHDVVTLPGREATCTLPGLTGGSYCARCSSSLSKQEEIPALGHDVVTDAAVAATCTETGLSEGSHCGRCNTVLAAQQTIPALGHSSVTDHAVAPTCAETGLTEGSHCGRCGLVLVKQETVPTVGHQFTDNRCSFCGLIGGECGAEGDNLTWTLADGVLTISGTGLMADYASSSEDGEYAPWFDFRSQIGKVVVQAGAESIGEYAFLRCSNLTEVTLPDSMTYIGCGAFMRCTGLKGITIPENVTAIGDHAFYMCSSLASITLPGGLTAIEAFTFYQCSSLASVAIPENVTAIGEEAFSFCIRLTGIAVPAGVTAIDNYAFYSCSALESVSLPENLTTIGNGAFYGCTSLKEITLPAGVTTVGESAFSGCGALTDITLPEGMTAIAASTFSDCTGLREIAIPENVTAIGASAFSGCIGLESVTFPAGLATMDAYAFAWCPGLNSITFQGSAPDLADTAFTDVTATACYPAGDASWTEDVKRDYGGTITWKALCETHTWSQWEVTTQPTCTENGTESRACASCGLVETRVLTALGHDTVIDQGYPPTDELPGLTDGSHCGRCGEILEPQKIIPIPGQATTLVLNRADLGEFGDLWVDGVPYGYNLDGEMLYVNLPDTERKILTLYSYNMTSDDPHQVYPVGMKVWRLRNDGTGYTVEALPELDNLLRYMGSSIRIVGVKGIRMITGVDEDLRARLIDGGVSGYTLEEYGTVLGWADQIVNGSLVLTDSYAKSNFAYKRGQADPIFSRANGVIAYTNVLVGFNDDQCVPDIAMRPYLILRDADGELLTVYGGMVQRSIGYIAWQNRGVFRPGTESYDYVWGIIHHVYGDQYDEEYAG